MPTSAEDQPGDRFRIYTPESLGAALRHFRELAGLSQAQLAETVGIHRSYLSDLEQGTQTEQVRRILRILRQLGVRVTLERADW